MPRYLTIITLGLSFLLGVVLAPLLVHAAPTAAAALGLRPVQADVDYDQPTAADAEKCELISEKVGTASGWVVYGGSGETLRRFLDTNNDKKVDRWCYYKNGIEIYRDIDTDYNGKADQYRWMGTAGMRWGLDRDEDGQLDSWKAISPEEVTEEIVKALRDRDESRFRRLLLSAEELAALGLSEAQVKPIQDKLDTAASSFGRIANSQKVVDEDSKWISFGGQRPGVIASGPDGPTLDVVVYDNVTAVIESDGKHAQLLVGSLIKVGDGWRAIDLPSNLVDQQASTNGYFFQASLARAEATAPGAVSEEFRKLLSTLEEVDQQLLASAPGANTSKLNARRADVLEQLIGATVHEDRENWIRQFADSVSAAVQSGIYPEGEARLQRLYTQLKTDGPQDPVTGYVKFRLMTASYGLQMQQPEVDFAKVQEQWIADLKAFIGDFADNEEGPEAMLQLAIAHEFAGEDTEAAVWYGRIADTFSGTPRGDKARGAKRRLESVGKKISLRGATLDGRTDDLASYQGKVVLVHYWATWYQQAPQDMQQLKAALAKHGAKNFALLGVNVDNDKAVAQQFLQSNRFPWGQLHEPGGLDSPLANELGIMTLPAMLLIDADGTVISRDMHLEELEAELEKRLK